MRNLCEKIVCLWGFAFCVVPKSPFLQMPVKNQKCRLQHCAGGDTFYGVLLRKSAYVYFSLFSLSGKTIEGLNVFASSGVIMAYDIIITTSPTCAFLAAAPFRQITPLPAGPLIT